MITILTLFLLDMLLVCLGDLWNFSSLLPTILSILNPLGVALIVALWKKWWSKEGKQTSILVDNLEKMLGETGFTKIDYCNGKIVKAVYEPQVDYYPEVKRLLEKHDLTFLLKKANEGAKDLQSKAETSMKEFHDIIEQKLKTVQLEKSMTIWEPLVENSYSLPRICQAVFDEIIGEKSGFDNTSGYLWHGDTKIARDNDSLDDLKSIIEKLVKDDKLIGKVNAFRESKTLLDSGELFSQFKSELKEIINRLRWNNP